MLQSTCRQLLRLVLYTLPVVLILGWAPPGEAKSSSLQQATASPTLTAEVMAENSRATAGAPGPATDIHGDMSAGTVTGGAAGTAGGKKDLTVFFSIGVIVDILLVTAFVVWAVGQWSKSKNRS